MAKVSAPKNSTKKAATKRAPTYVSPPKASVKDWKELFPTLKRKDDYKVRYYYSGKAAATFFNGRTKRQYCPPAATVTAQLPLFVQGYTQDLNANVAPIVTFKTMKHIFGFMDYVSTLRNQHNDIVEWMILPLWRFLKNLFTVKINHDIV